MGWQVDDEVSFRRLEVFLAYLRAESLTGAAEATEISSVSVHRALHSLEAGMRCTLFRREGRSLVPTEAAYMLADIAEEVIERMSRGIESVREAAGYSSNRLKIGTIYSLTADLLPDLIKRASNRKPDLRFELELGRSKYELLSKLKQGRLDAVLAEVLTGDPDLLWIPIFTDRIYFAAPLGSPHASKTAIDLRECIDERIITLTEGPFTADKVREIFPEFRPVFAMEVIDIFTMMNLVATGFAHALAPGRVRKMYEDKVRFIPLNRAKVVNQEIGLCVMRTRERDPNLLSLSSVVRMHVRERASPSRLSKGEEV